MRLASALKLPNVKTMTKIKLKNFFTLSPRECSPDGHYTQISI